MIVKFCFCILWIGIISWYDQLMSVVRTPLEAFSGTGRRFGPKVPDDDAPISNTNRYDYNSILYEYTSWNWTSLSGLTLRSIIYPIFHLHLALSFMSTLFNSPLQTSIVWRELKRISSDHRPWESSWRVTTAPSYFQSIRTDLVHLVLILFSAEWLSKWLKTLLLWIKYLPYLSELVNVGKNIAIGILRHHDWKQSVELCLRIVCLTFVG